MIRTRLLVAATTSQGRPAAARLAAARPAHLIAHPVYLITLSAASYRQDGKLLVAGEESGRVQVFDVATKNILRQYDAHKRPCKVTKFLHSGSELFSGADDGVVRLWDVPTGQEKSTLRGHEDYVRCGSASVASPHLFVTGAYDHTIKLWDSRMEEPVHSVNHGFPVESVLFFASGGAFVAAGLWAVVSERAPGSSSYAAVLKLFSSCYQAVAETFSARLCACVSDCACEFVNVIACVS
eukprot:m.338727 g.338727  ORF g.338727 m.338727 type:complete len:239 (-) comp19811_c0_seq6:1053-1769(-)